MQNQPQEMDKWLRCTSVREVLCPFPHRLCHSYLLNPYIILPSLALSTSSFENALALVAIMFACRGTQMLKVYPAAVFRPDIRANVSRYACCSHSGAAVIAVYPPARTSCSPINHSPRLTPYATTTFGCRRQTNTTRFSRISRIHSRSHVGIDTGLRKLDVVGEDMGRLVSELRCEILIIHLNLI